MTIRLPHPPRVPYDNDPRLTAVLWRASRLERTKRYVERSSLQGAAFRSPDVVCERVTPTADLYPTVYVARELWINQA